MVHRGPVKDRSCTDVICLLIFVVFLVGWGAVGYLGKKLRDFTTQTCFCVCGRTLESDPFPYF